MSADSLTSTPNAESPVTAFQVGDLLVDIGTASVSRDGQQLALPRLSFDLLVALIRAAPNLLTLDELMDRVWPGLIVEPDTVSQRVKLLRQVLGDDSRDPRYIAGIRGRGYRLIAPVTTPQAPIAPVAAATAADATPTPAPAAAPMPVAARPGRLRRWLPAVTLLLMAVAVVWWRVSGDTRGSGAAAAALPARSVAVLPFVNLNQDTQGDALSLGIPEAVLHQLASLPELTVIARTSSFAFRGRQRDIREIGASLNARYLVEGSVQKDQRSLRVTAQLIDAVDGSHVWSMQFDRRPEELLALQDDIARAVSQALEVSVDAASSAGPARARLRDFDANLEYMQANALLASWRLGDLQMSVEHAQRALRLDPEFADAYVTLAQGQVRAVEFSAGPARAQRFEEAVNQGLLLVNKALTLDPNSASAYFQRAYLTAFRDLIAAEADYRRGLALAPSSSVGLEGLAVVVNENRARQSEALGLMERARRLDPLDPRLDVVNATMILYGRGDIDGADRLLRRALQLDPVFVPAIFRLQEVRWLQGQFAEGIRFGEQVVSLDPGNEQARKLLQLLYLDVMDSGAIRRMAEKRDHAWAIARMINAVDQRQWSQAAAAFFEADAQGLLTPLEENVGLLAVRMDVRAHHGQQQAIAVLTRRAGVSWSDSGTPTINDRGGQWSNAIALGDVLLQAGQVERGRRLLTIVVAEMQRELAAGRRGSLWIARTLPVALALLGQTDATLQALADPGLRRYRFNGWRQYLAMEPAYDGLRSNPQFRQLLADVSTRAERELSSLRQMRQAGLASAQQQ